MLPVRVAEGDVDAGQFFVLEDVADHMLQLDVRPDGKFAHAVAVVIGMGVAPELVFEGAVPGMDLADAVALDADGERFLLQLAVFRTQVIAHHTVDHVGAVHFRGRGEHFPAGQVAPFFRADDAAGLDPTVFAREVGLEAGSRRSFRADVLGAPSHLPHLAAELIHLAEISTHAFQHDLAVDVDHVGVADAPAVHDRGHLHARGQFAGLSRGGEDAHLARFQVVEDGLGHVPQRTLGEIFQGPHLVGSAHSGDFTGDAASNFLRLAVSDQRNFFLRPDAQAHSNGITGAGKELRIERRGRGH